MVRPLRTGPSATCLSQVPGGGWRSRYPRLIACQCVSLAFRSGGQSQQLAASCSLPEKKSVTAVTDVRDCGQTGCNEFSVFPRTGRVMMDSKGCQWLEEVYFSLATTNSGAQSSARLISVSGKERMASCADSAYCAARAVAASSDP